MDTISDITPTASATDALSPLEQLRAKIRDAEKEFAKALRTEFAAMRDRASELYDEIDEAAHFDGDGHVRKALNKALKALDEVVETLSDDTDTDERDITGAALTGGASLFTSKQTNGDYRWQS